MVGRGRVYVPFQLSDLRGIKKYLDSYTDAPDQYIQNLYLCDPNLSIDMKEYHTSTGPDSFLIRKAMGSGPGHSGWK
jgi:hypothetical protein